MLLFIKLIKIKNTEKNCWIVLCYKRKKQLYHETTCNWLLKEVKIYYIQYIHSLRDENSRWIKKWMSKERDNNNRNAKEIKMVIAQKIDQLWD